MFKAKDTSNSTDVIILDHLDPAALRELRRKAEDNHLRCPVCQQPVSVKAGEKKVSHFAHKHLADCPSQSESPELLQARASLYHWLDSKFSVGVTVERQLEHIPLPRHIDCWVDRSDGRPLAYWIFEGQAKPDYRRMVRDGIERAGAAPVFVFLAKLMQRNDKPKDILNLTTTERDFLSPTDHDEPYREARPRGVGSLHYLDATAGAVTTFRAMECIESPQEYGGDEITTALPQLLVLPSSGQFVHPGEVELLNAWRLREQTRRAEEERQRQQAEESARRLAAERRLNQEAWERARQERMQHEAALQVPSVRPMTKFQPAKVKAAPPPAASTYGNREGVCELCGARTRDWYVFNGGTGMCKCNACLKNRRSE